MKKIIHLLINLVSILILLFFAIPKILGQAKSVAGFNQFESLLGIDATFFRLFTGFSELAIIILILIYTFIRKKIAGKLAYLFLFVTMITALGIEFFIRPEPVMLLVIIAIVLSLFSIYQLKYILNHE
ncbi:hypothetical protein [Bizionia arctica]|uniref:DoxX-like family protein n=1 Tax=Bizionia arctica TaxID=1495645 RepID=A0A917GG40_9FLAO|nr:hypothetical protein [Bizionia arctica]GGG44752.1 hypothetical protein GCM10010976_15450 [Bizionia arctica]